MQPPIELAHQKHLSAGLTSFEEDREIHKKVGYELSTDLYFLLWRCVSPDWPLERMLDLSQAEPQGECAWIWMIAGEWQEACLAGLQVCPWVKFAAYERRGKARFLDIRRAFN